MAKTFYDNWFGPAMTYRLMRLLTPRLAWNQEIYALVLARHLNDSTRWLDVGCGRRLLGAGLESQENALLSAPHVLIGLDAELQSLLDNTGLRYRICGDVTRQPFPDGYFDLLSCNMVLEHLPDPNHAFAEFSRLLRPGGHLVIHTPNVWNYAVFAIRFVKKYFSQKAISKLAAWSDGRVEVDVFPTFYRANSRRSLRRLAAAHGLEEVLCKIVVGPQPILKPFALLALIEILWMRALMTAPLRPMATSIIGVYGKGI